MIHFVKIKPENNYQADFKRAKRQLIHARRLAEQNGVGDEAMASACLTAFAEMMTQSKGRELAMASLRTTMDQIVAGEFDDKYKPIASHLLH